jgi:beta-galactosidase
MAERPMTVVRLGDNDMNSWDPVVAGERPSPPVTAGFVTLAAHISLGDAMLRPGATLHFDRIAGSGSIIVNGATVATKSDPAPAALDISLPPGHREYDVALILESVPGKPLGLPGAAFVKAPPLQ